MESDIKVICSPKQMVEAFEDTEKALIRFYEIQGKWEDLDTPCVYQVRIRHEEYLSYLSNKKPYSSWENVYKAMERKKKEMEMPRFLCSKTIVIHLAGVIKKYYPEYKDCQINTYGPFGTREYSSIYIKRDGKRVGFLTVETDGKECYYNKEKEKHVKLPNNVKEVIHLIFA